MNRSALNQLKTQLHYPTGPVPQYRSHILKDENGIFNAITDCSGVTYPYFFTPGAGQIFRAQRLLITVEDSLIAADNYGNLSELTHGIEVGCCTGQTNMFVSLTEERPIVNNVGWATHCYDMVEHTFGAGNNFITARWSFDKGHVPIRLDGNEDQYLTIFCNDDFQGLVNHTFVIQGYEE